MTLGLFAVWNLWAGISAFPRPASLAVSRPSLSPCSALRSTGELYLICDRIVLLCSLHLVSQKWYCSGMRKSLASSGACPCVQSEGRHCMRMLRMEDVPKMRNQAVAPCGEGCVFTSTTASSWKASHVILIICVLHSHGTIRSNYRVVQTKSQEWYPAAGREAILSSPKASIMGLQW